MIDIERLRLTEDEILYHSHESAWVKGRRIADTQLVKAVFGVLAMIEEVDAEHSHEFPAGYFIENVTNALNVYQGLSDSMEIIDAKPRA